MGKFIEIDCRVALFKEWREGMETVACNGYGVYFKVKKII